MDINLQDKTIVVIDDEFSQRKLLYLIFTKGGANVHTAAGHQEGLALLETHAPDLMLIDIMMPEVDGITLCRQVREISDVPIIIVSAKRRPEDVVAGLRAGADDYIIKPYDFKVLVERAKAAIRRGKNGLHAPVHTTFRDDVLFIDLENQRVIVEDEPVKLDGIEFALLDYLVRNANKPCTYSDILVNVWGENCGYRPEYIHAYIWRLRQKIEPSPKQPVYFVTEDNDVGFRFIFAEAPAAEKTPLTVESNSAKSQPGNQAANGRQMRMYTNPLVTANGRLNLAASS